MQLNWVNPWRYLAFRLFSWFWLVFILTIASAWLLAKAFLDDTVIRRLPPLLKRISIVHYLESQLPVPIKEGPFVTVVAATPFWASLLGLLVFVAILLLGGARRIRSVEVKPLDA